MYNINNFLILKRINNLKAPLIKCAFSHAGAYLHLIFTIEINIFSLVKENILPPYVLLKIIMHDGILAMVLASLSRLIRFFKTTLLLASTPCS